MRTTTEVIEAARMGEPCTEEELRMAIVSMRLTMAFAHLDHARWAEDETLPLKVRTAAMCHWRGVNDGWNIPLDERVHPGDRPGHPSLKERTRIATALWTRAHELAEEGQEP